MCAAVCSVRKKMDDPNSTLPPVFYNPKRPRFLVSLIEIFSNNFGSLSAFQNNIFLIFSSHISTEMRSVLDLKSAHFSLFCLLCVTQAFVKAYFSCTQGL